MPRLFLDRGELKRLLDDEGQYNANAAGTTGEGPIASTTTGTNGTATTSMDVNAAGRRLPWRAVRLEPPIRRRAIGENRNCNGV
jgi:hypothetical protein